MQGLITVSGQLEGVSNLTRTLCTDENDDRRILIEHAVMAVFRVPRVDLSSPTRGRKRVAFARQVAMYLAHVTYGLNYKDTGRLFGRDRTTAAHACEVIEDRREDPIFERVMQLLESITQALLSRREVAEVAGQLEMPICELGAVGSNIEAMSGPGGAL